MYDRPMILDWSRDRLRNEAATLKFIAENTTIPVPRLIDFYEDEQVSILNTSAILGNRFPLVNQLDEMIDDPNRQQALLEKVNFQLENDILPQLHSLKSKRLGNLNGIVIPPERILGDTSDWRNRRLNWSPKYAKTEKYVFCHNDLGRHNIIIDCDTFDIAYIIDWEYAGFYPPGMEKKFWLQTQMEYFHQLYDGLCDEDTAAMVRMLDEPGKKSESSSFDRAPAEIHR